MQAVPHLVAQHATGIMSNGAAVPNPALNRTGRHAASLLASARPAG